MTPELLGPEAKLYVIIYYILCIIFFQKIKEILKIPPGNRKFKLTIKL